MTRSLPETHDEDCAPRRVLELFSTKRPDRVPRSDTSRPLRPPPARSIPGLSSKGVTR